MKNLEEFRKLIKRYESITLKEIKKAAVSLAVIFSGWFGKSKAKALTGFGSGETCTLCIAVEEYRKERCKECCWFHLTKHKCNEGDNWKTYSKICNADDEKKLLKAFKARAKYMRKVLERWENEQH